MWAHRVVALAGALLAVCPSSAVSDDSALDELLAAIDTDSDGTFSREEVRAMLLHFNLKQPACPTQPGQVSPYCRPEPIGDAEEEGCSPGWAGEDCDECAPGFGGALCTPLPAAGGGGDDGCMEGWTGDDCDECAPGYEGDDCTAVGSAPDAVDNARGVSGSEAVHQHPSGQVTTVEFKHSTPVFVDENEPAPTWDPNGYLLAHFCQGRFGNQFDYLLNLLDLASRTGRTLILPPYTDYSAQDTMGQYPWFWWFGEVFDTEHLKQHVNFKFIELGTFMVHFREKWAAAGFVGHCTYPNNRMDGWYDTCMVDISPKRPFWKNLGVEFERQEVLLTGSHRMIKKVEHPVVALDCAPGKYPAPPRLDKYAAALNWSVPIQKEAEAFIADELERPYIAVHIRQAFFDGCDGRPMTHSSGQCRPWLEAEGNEYPEASPKFPNEICHPSSEIMREQLEALMNATGAKSLFVASDNPIGTQDLKFMREDLGAKTLRGGLRDAASGYLRPQVDLAILTAADHFIAHCPSSFSHIAARMRKESSPPRSVSYWGMGGEVALKTLA